MKFRILALAAAMTLGLAGCGGGDDGNDGGGNGGTPPPPPPPPVVTGAGFYNGMTTEANGNLVATTLAFPDGSYYAIFTQDPFTSTIEPFVAFVTGKGTYDSGNFTSTNAHLFLAGGGTPVTFSASYTVKTSITGKVGLADPTETVGFTGAYDSTYEATPTLSAITGTFTGAFLGSTDNSGGDGSGNSADDVTLNISNTGAVTGSTSGCNFTGTATPKTSGNAYDLTITLGAAPCVLPGKTVSGAALFRGSVLLAIATTSDGANGFYFEGTKAVPR